MEAPGVEVLDALDRRGSGLCATLRSGLRALCAGVKVTHPLAIFLPMWPLWTLGFGGLASVSLDSACCLLGAWLPGP